MLRGLRPPLQGSATPPSPDSEGTARSTTAVDLGCPCDPRTGVPAQCPEPPSPLLAESRLLVPCLGSVRSEFRITRSSPAVQGLLAGKCFEIHGRTPLPRHRRAGRGRLVRGLRLRAARLPYPGQVPGLAPRAHSGGDSRVRGPEGPGRHGHHVRRCPDGRGLSRGPAPTPSCEEGAESLGEARVRGRPQRGSHVCLRHPDGAQPWFLSTRGRTSVPGSGGRSSATRALRWTPSSSTCENSSPRPMTDPAPLPQGRTIAREDCATPHRANCPNARMRNTLLYARPIPHGWRNDGRGPRSLNAVPSPAARIWRSGPCPRRSIRAPFLA